MTVAYSKSAYRVVEVDPAFSLAQTAAPAAWSKGRWANHDWIDDSLYWVGWEDGLVRWRQISQPCPGALEITGSADLARDREWLAATHGIEAEMPIFGDPVIQSLAYEFPGLRHFAAGSIYDGLFSSIIGQSITVMAAAVVERRIANLFNPVVELLPREFVPLPRADQLATADPADLRAAGLTWRRAHALVAISRAEADGEIPGIELLASDAAGLRKQLRLLPLCGPWTVESTLLWGAGDPNAHPTRDVALLRAVRQRYELPVLDLNGLDRLAESWQPYRGWAARLLWTWLLGPAPSGC